MPLVGRFCRDECASADARIERAHRLVERSVASCPWRRRHVTSIAAVLAASVLWGTTGVVAQQAPAGTDQMLVGLSTFGFGGLLLFVLGPGAATRVLRERGSWPLVGVALSG